ncbi:MAG: putative Na+/H+ antiporter [Planctomycetes bacterium]|nr:putative Na+/H+ antiporter [Planctomycetota bacterium]
MNPSTAEIVASILFGLAVLHTFCVSKFQKIAHRFPDGSPGENVFHLLGEVEIVFGLWAGILVCYMAIAGGGKQAVQFVEGLNFTEPAFVFVVMSMAATAPVILVARGAILLAARLIPVGKEPAVYFACLFVGPLLGSFITEPAAMTLTAIILRQRYYEREVSRRFQYVTLAVLFVNISIGGALTPYAAPPVLMVASKWGWDLAFMMQTFGYKVALAVFLNAATSTCLLRGELTKLGGTPAAEGSKRMPAWVVVIHLLFLALVVITAHHPVIFMGIFLFFLGVAQITREYQERLKLREALLVAYFLAGLVVLGGLQRWWLEPLLGSMDALPLFLGTACLTAFTDNAALTYLGSQVTGISEVFKYALVAGAIAGGGLTVIANAPNPAGYSILQDRFGPDGIAPLRLLGYALAPTVIALACLWMLP